jgi:hypothetical protein
MESFGISAGLRGISAGPRWVDGPAAARRLRVVRPLGSAARPRPGVRLTRRGRGVLIVLALLLAAVATVLAAPQRSSGLPEGGPSRVADLAELDLAADPSAPPVTSRPPFELVPRHAHGWGFGLRGVSWGTNVDHNM